MKVVLPHKKQAKPVTHPSQLKDAYPMIGMLRGKFAGKWKEGFALSHAQVSDDPYAFFVVSDKFKDEFPSQIMANARIIDQADRMPFKEACLSFPHRDVINTTRYRDVQVEAEIPGKQFFNKALKKIMFQVSGLAAFIVQHEIDHAKGINIYEKYKKN